MILAIDTATAACSLALFDGPLMVGAHHQIIGRGHAEQLVPAIDNLMKGRQAEHILVDCGPGSFTGLRVGLATARALALAWQSEIHGYSSLALMARMAFAKPRSPDTLAVTIHGGHGEVFVQQFSKSPFANLTALSSVTPAAAMAAIEEPLLVGDAAGPLAEQLGVSSDADLLPNSACVLDLPQEFRTLAPLPLYGRAPDAQPNP